MDRQHLENLFRRYKGKTVTIKTVSGGLYEGRVVEITNDFVGLIEREATDPSHVFVFFNALESMVVIETTD